MYIYIYRPVKKTNLVYNCAIILRKLYKAINIYTYIWVKKKIVIILRRDHVYIIQVYLYII